MNFVEAREKYGKEIGTMKRNDLNANFRTHFESKIRPFCLETNLDFGEACNLYSPSPEKINGRNRPQDAIIDLMAYKGHRIFNEGGVRSSPARDFFSDKVIQDDDDPSFELGCGYLQNIWRNTLEFGIGVDARYSRAYNRIVNSAFSRSDLNRTLDPHATQMMAEPTRRFRPRLRIQDVVAGNEPIESRHIDVPIVTETGDRENRGTAGRRLPRESMGVSEETVHLSETGRELEIQDTVRRSSTITIQTIAEHQALRALRQENSIVNAIVNIIGTGATPIAWSATPSVTEVIRLHMTPDDDYVISNIVGQLEAIAMYANVDPTTKSGESKDGVPMRDFIDSMLGTEIIAKRDPDKVPVLKGGDNKNRIIAWYQMGGFQFYTERGGTISDMYREEAVRSFILRNVITYGGRLKADADNCRWLITFG